MNGNCHFVYGAALGTAVVLNLNTIATVLPNITDTPETAALMIMGGVLGGVFPDIDNPKSHFGQLTVPISTMFGAVGKATGKTGSHHRGIMHDPIVYIVGIILSYLYFAPLIGFFLGGLSHLFLDMFNPSGIPFLFGAKRLHLGKIVSGSKESIIFTWVNVVLVLSLGIALLFAAPYLLENLTTSH